MSEYYFIRGREVLQSQGAIPEAFMEKALGYYDRKGSPFLQEYKKPCYQIYLDDFKVLHLGKTVDFFPEIPTWRQFLRKYQGYTKHDLSNRLDQITSFIGPDELNEEMDYEYFIDQWAHIYSPSAQFAHLIDELKVGTQDAKSGDILGSLKRYEGSFTGADVLCMRLDEPITLSWLQWAMEREGKSANFHHL